MEKIILSEVSKEIQEEAGSAIMTLLKIAATWDATAFNLGATLDGLRLNIEIKITKEGDDKGEELG